MSWRWKVIEDTLDGMDGELEEKADNYAIIMAELDAEARSLKKKLIALRRARSSYTDGARC